MVLGFHVGGELEDLEGFFQVTPRAQNAPQADTGTV